MNNFVVEIFEDEGRKCSFYTVRWDSAQTSETDKFFVKFSAEKNLRPYVQELAYLISEKIGNQLGAKEVLFRFENTAQALPPSKEMQFGEVMLSYRSFPLRLYCLRLSEKLVVLFGGGEKTSRTAQSGKTSMAFSEANFFAKRILEALQEGDLVIDRDGRHLLAWDGSDDLLV